MAEADSNSDGSGGFCGAPCRLVRDRDGTPTLHGLRAAAYRGFGFPAGGAGGRKLRRGVRHCVSRGVWRRYFLSAAHDGQAAADGGSGTGDGRSDAQRRHHAWGGPAAGAGDRSYELGDATVAIVELIAVRLSCGRAIATPSPQSKSAVADFDRFIEWPKPAYTRFRLGEGWGGGSRCCGNALPPLTTPTLDPSPQGGGEESATLLRES